MKETSPSRASGEVFTASQSGVAIEVPANIDKLSGGRCHEQGGLTGFLIRQRGSFSTETNPLTGPRSCLGLNEIERLHSLLS